MQEQTRMSANAMEQRPKMHEREVAGIRRAVRFLHERADTMNDPNAKQVLNSAAFVLGVTRASGVEVTREEMTWNPDWATHPGQHLKEYLEVRGLKQAEFARLAGLTPKLVSEIINQKNPVTPETAIVLERVLGLTAEIWMSIQTDWDLFQLRKEQEKHSETH